VGPAGPHPDADGHGTDGKTTSPWLVAAMVRAAGHRVGLNSPEGLWVDDARVMGGDYAGPDDAHGVLVLNAHDFHQKVAPRR